MFDIGKIVFDEFNITDIDCDFFSPECKVTPEDIFINKYMIERATNIQTTKSQIEAGFS